MMWLPCRGNRQCNHWYMHFWATPFQYRSYKFIGNHNRLPYRVPLSAPLVQPINGITTIGSPLITCLDWNPLIGNPYCIYIIIFILLLTLQPPLRSAPLSPYCISLIAFPLLLPLIGIPLLHFPYCLPLLVSPYWYPLIGSPLIVFPLLLTLTGSPHIIYLHYCIYIYIILFIFILLYLYLYYSIYIYIIVFIFILLYLYLYYSIYIYIIVFIFIL